MKRVFFKFCPAIAISGFNYKNIVLPILISLFLLSCEQKELITSVDDLHRKIEKAQPGDTLWLANGEWKDAEIVIKGKGKKDQPIVIAAETPGKLKITGNSNLRIGGEYLVISGLHFTKGYTLTQEVISFRINKKQLANNCRVTQTVVSDFSKPERHDSDYWVGIYGKNNRFDHNALVGKGNRGVTMAVRLNTEESRENSHIIDHNYFGPRENLGSNGGETLRIGTSHYSLTNANTQILNNYFDRCDGEHEIISNKSCGNLFKGNTFYECVGTLTFRHGNQNIAESNAFFGNRKPHTGGIRVINEGQIVKNNYGYGLTGHRFRGALVVMNGVPNSPINRYHQVKNAEINNNTFIDCDYVQLCAGSDQERSAVPKNSSITNNIFWNTKKNDVFTVYDDISGIAFKNNLLSENIDQILKNGFFHSEGKISKDDNGFFNLLNTPVEVGINKDFKFVKKELTGPEWYQKPELTSTFGFGEKVEVKKGSDLYEVIKTSERGDIINLEEGEYLFTKTAKINHPLTIKSDGKAVLKFENPNLFAIENGGSLNLEGIIIDGSEAPDYAGNAVITTSKYSMNKNYKLFIDKCEFRNLDVNHSFNILKVHKNTFADSIMIENSTFKDISGCILELNKEIEDVGIYNAEFVILKNNSFTNIGREVVNLHRGGSDESTFGPLLYLDHCVLENVGFHKKNKTGNAISLHGVQRTEISNTIFNNIKPIDIFHTVGEPITSISHINIENKKLIKISDQTAEIGKVWTEDPQFVNSNFKLTGNSHLIKSGNDQQNVGLIK